VDWTHTGYEDGSSAFPFDTVQEGIDAAGNGTNMIISVGDYDETGVTRFEKRGQVNATGGEVIIR
jgi:hypothetical protein